MRNGEEFATEKEFGDDGNGTTFVRADVREAEEAAAEGLDDGEGLDREAGEGAEEGGLAAVGAVGEVENEGVGGSPAQCVGA